MMKSKIITALALMLLVCAFILPVNVYASARPPTIHAGIIGEIIHIEAVGGDFGLEAIFVNNHRFNYRVDSTLNVDLMAFRDSETISIFAVDFAGNVSNIVTLVNLLFVPSLELPSDNEQAGITVQGNPFTPAGQAQVLDHAHNSDDKEFFTFTTPAGNVFFLIIDHQRESDNVYFLNPVTERDLLAMAERAGTPISEGIPVYIPSTPPVEQVVTPPLQTPQQPPVQGSNNGTLIFLVFAVAAVSGAGYYFKIIRPKQQAQSGDDFEDEDEEDGEEMEFTDEPDDTEDLDIIETEDDEA